MTFQNMYIHVYRNYQAFAHNKCIEIFDSVDLPSLSSTRDGILSQISQRGLPT